MSKLSKLLEDEDFLGECAAGVVDALFEADARIAELEASIDANDEWAKGFIEKTDARIAELEAALKPFAESVGPESDCMSDKALSASIFTMGDLRAARAYLEKK